jgi:hypothetical protein
MEVIQPHSNAIQLLLTLHNDWNHLFYAINRLQLNHPGQLNHEPFYPIKFGFYDHFYRDINMDEKWFFVSKASQKIYLAHDEVPPERNVRHKSHI